MFSSKFQSLSLDITVDPDRVELVDIALNKWYLQTRDAIPAPWGSLVFYTNTPMKVVRYNDQLSLNPGPVERVIDAMEK